MGLLLVSVLHQRLIKLLIVRYGGMKYHNAAVPFFLGLILGDYTMGRLG